MKIITDDQFVHYEGDCGCTARIQLGVPAKDALILDEGCRHVDEFCEDFVYAIIDDVNTRLTERTM